MAATAANVVVVPCEDDGDEASWCLTEAELERMFGPGTEEPSFDIPLADIMNAFAERAKMTAYHEAGHAVASFELLGKASTVEVGLGRGFAATGNADDLSLARFDRILDAIHAGRVEDERWVLGQSEEQIAYTHFVLESDQQIALAGPLAQSRVSGVALARVLEISGAEDLAQWEHSQALLAHVRTIDRDRDWKRIVADTESLLDRQWSAVERLAVELLRRGRMSPDDVRAVLR